MFGEKIIDGIDYLFPLLSIDVNCDFLISTTRVSRVFRGGRARGGRVGEREPWPPHGLSLLPPSGPYLFLFLNATGPPILAFFLDFFV